MPLHTVTSFRSSFALAAIVEPPGVHNDWHRSGCFSFLNPRKSDITQFSPNKSTPDISTGIPVESSDPVKILTLLLFNKL